MEEPEQKRMITPEPVLMVNESGRLFEFELGRFEKFKKEEGDDNNEGEEYEEKWITYKFNQRKE